MITLDQETHTYRDEKGRKVSGVTSILQDVFGTKPYWSEWHAQRGRAVHYAIHLLVNGSLDWNTVDDRIAGRIKAFERFIRETGWKVVESEILLYSRKWRYAGTADLIMVTPQSEFVLVDIKPPNPDPIVELQLAAYANAIKEMTGNMHIESTMALCLDDEAGYRFKPFGKIKESNFRLAQSAFMSCLNISNWMNKE